MRGSFTSHDFCSSVERIVGKWYSQRAKTLRNHVLDNTNFLGTDFFFKVKRINVNTFIKLAITSWYMDEEVKFVIQADLEEKIKTFPIEHRSMLQQLLYSKAEMLIFLLETNLWHTREFFGNILTDLDQLDAVLKPSISITKVKKVQRKRGYQDHGSRVLSHKWMPKSDYTLTEMQNTLEEERITQQDSANFLRGFLN
jgi:hypothetical protein